MIILELKSDLTMFLNSPFYEEKAERQKLPHNSHHRNICALAGVAQLDWV